PELKPRERREVDLELRPGLDLCYHGRVVAASDGRPIPGARVQLHSRAVFGPRWIRATSDRATGSRAADTEGRFEVRTSEGGDTIARIEAPGFSPTLRRIEAGHAQREEEDLVELSAPGTLGAS